MSDLTLDVGLAYKIKQALFRNGITDVADLDWLATGDNIAKIRRVRLGYDEIVTPKHLIDLDADPFVPDGQSVEEHQKGGQFKWDAAKVKLYLTSGQKDGKVTNSNKLRKKLRRSTSSTLICLITSSPIHTLFPRSGKANTSTSGGQSTATGTATSAFVASTGAATGGAGASIGSAATGTTTILLWLMQVEMALDSVLLHLSPLPLAPHARAELIF